MSDTEDLQDEIEYLEKKITELEDEIDDLQTELNRTKRAGVVNVAMVIELFREKLRQTPAQFEETLRQFFIKTIDRRL